MFKQSYIVHMTPLIINNLEGGHTYTHERHNQFLENQALSGLMNINGKGNNVLNASPF